MDTTGIIDTIDLANFARLTSSATIDLALRYYGPRLLQEALDADVSLTVANLGEGPTSGICHWIRDFDGVRKQVGPGCEWTTSRIRSYINILAIKYPGIDLDPQSGTQRARDVFGVDEMDGIVYAYHANGNAVSILDAADMFEAAMHLREMYERR